MTAGLPLTTSDILRRIRLIQSMMSQENVDAWIIIDHRNKNPIGRRLLGRFTPFTRQYAILILASGKIIIIRPWIEGHQLDEFQSQFLIIKSYKTLEQFGKLLRSYHFKRITMDFDSNNPEIDYIPAGRVKFIERALKTSTTPDLEIISSRDFIQILNAVLTKPQIANHKETAIICSRIMKQAFAFIFHQLKTRSIVTEHDVSNHILFLFEQNQLTTDHPPIVAVGRNTANPHHISNDTIIKNNQLVLIDLWAKSEIYADMTWMGFTGETPPKRAEKLFELLLECQSMALEQIKPGIQGYVVDEIVRDHISKAGYGEFFTHRTGHSIDTEVHGQGANLDSYEMIETRKLVPGLITSVEPGIYISDNIGLRSEIDVVITQNGYELTTEQQQNILCSHSFE